jgi:hypothetical protein
MVRLKERVLSESDFQMNSISRYWLRITDISYTDTAAIDGRREHKPEVEMEERAG